MLAQTKNIDNDLCFHTRSLEACDLKGFIYAFLIFYLPDILE